MDGHYTAAVGAEPDLPGMFDGQSHNLPSCFQIPDRGRFVHRSQTSAIRTNVNILKRAAGQAEQFAPRLQVPGPDSWGRTGCEKRRAVEGKDDIVSRPGGIDQIHQ